MNSNTVRDEFYDAINCAAEWEIGSSAERWANRVTAAGYALLRDYDKAVERANREAQLAVALRKKLEEVAGAQVASSVT